MACPDVTRTVAALVKARARFEEKIRPRFDTRGYEVRASLLAFNPSPGT